MFLQILLVIISICIIALALLQSGKAEGVISALTGQSSGLFAQTKERGAELIITRITAGLAIAWFVFAVLIRMG